MSTRGNPAQVLLRSNAKDSRLIHTTRVSVVFVAASNSSIDLKAIELPNRYHNATVNTSLNALLQPSFRELNPDVVAMTHPKLRAVDKAILTSTFLHLHVQQRTFYSLGLPTTLRAAEHEPRFVSIPCASKKASSRVQACLENLGSKVMRISTGVSALRLPPSVNGSVVLEQSEIKPLTKHFCAPVDSILNAPSILVKQDEQDILTLVDHVQELAYNSHETPLAEKALSGVPTLSQEMRVSISNYNGYCTPRLVDDVLQCARKTVSKLCEGKRDMFWASVFAVAPQSAPISWRVSSSGKPLLDDQKHWKQAAEMFFITKDHCLGAQLKNP